ncbi:Ca(2+)-dependent cysteine protease [Hanseniaspora osmophila]|uniref:Metacaspase-1 n=1 Tax=Hanseniaspora osmophila TaxID=56408 RepID=A0A1E5R872_9ASCO|nr:Metacaspase-1 [Hanseniaspora osmophila]
MFPGSGRYTYNNNQQQQQQQQQQYSRPSAPPPGQYQGEQQYSRPSAPPPGQYQQEQQQYSRPAAPPPGSGSNRYPDNGLNSSDYSFTNVNGNTNGNINPQAMQQQATMNNNASYSNAQANQQQSSANSHYVQPQQQYRPPSQVQTSANTNTQFQYSQCTGRRKALIVGINYFNSQNELRGCINDAQNMFNFLCSQYGYSHDDIVILTDDQSEMGRVPLRANIIRAMQWLVKDARPNDSLVFHYSGHGGQTKDLDGDEDDGMDDVIYPVDFQQTSHITDDEMHDIMVKVLPQGCRLTALFDSCHSGSVLDLPYTYSTKGVIKEPNMYKALGQEGLQTVLSYATGNKQAMMSGISSIFKTVTSGGSHLSAQQREQVKQMKFSPADVVMFSGCKDDQTSADASENGRATGALSWAFMKVIGQQPQQSYLTLLQNMRYELSSKYSQKPQLSSSHPIDVNLQFIM